MRTLLLAPAVLVPFFVACGASHDEPPTAPSSDLAGSLSTSPSSPPARSDGGADGAGAAPAPACTRDSRAIDCWRVAKAGGSGATAARDQLHASCKDRSGLVECAATLDLLGGTLDAKEAEKAASEGCNPHADGADEARLQAAACLKKGADLVAREKFFLAMSAYDEGCQLGSDGCCDASKQVHVALQGQGRDLPRVQFPMGGIVDDTKTYVLSDVGCILDKSTDMMTYFSGVGAPFFERKKTILACTGPDAHIPVRWTFAQGHVTEVHADGPKGSCVEKAIAHAPSKIEAHCSGLLLAGQPAKDRKE